MNLFRDQPIPPIVSIVQAPDYQVYSHSCPFFGLAQTLGMEAARQEIEQIAALDANWDGYGALRIQEQTKRNALAAVELMLLWAPVPDIVPNPNGTISMEWETDSGIGHFEIGQSMYSFYIERQDGDPILSDGSAGDVVPQLGLVISSVLFPVTPGAAASTIVEGNVPSSNRRSGL